MKRRDLVFLDDPDLDEAQPIWPMPVAPTPLAQRWLERMRLGALVAAATPAVLIVWTVLAWTESAPLPPTMALLLLPLILNPPAAAGIWLLLTPEPARPRWFGRLRPAWRGLAVVLAVVSVGLPVLWLARSDRPPSHISTQVGTMLLTVLTMTLLAGLFYYGAALAGRLGQRPLRAVFRVLWWATAILAGLTWMGLFAYMAGYGRTSAPSTRPEEAAETPGWAIDVFYGVQVVALLAVTWTLVHLAAGLRAAAESLAEE